MVPPYGQGISEPLALSCHLVQRQSSALFDFICSMDKYHAATSAHKALQRFKTFTDPTGCLEVFFLDVASLGQFVLHD
jgi:hypothetical protein